MNGTRLRNLKQTGKPDQQLGSSLPQKFEHCVSLVGAVDIWYASLSSTENDLSFYQSLLSTDEIDRTERLHLAHDRHRFISCRALLRILLADTLNAKPASLVFEYSKYGKPVLSGQHATLNFNLSHSETHVLFALSKTHKVGVDIESLDRSVDSPTLSIRYCTPVELAALNLLPQDQQRQAFLTCWTRKEALAKGLGLGLHMPFSSVTTGIAAEVSEIDKNELPINEVSWKLYPVNTLRNYVATIAVSINPDRAPR